MLRRLVTVGIVLGALSAPLPLFASFCAPQHSCCAPAGDLVLDAPDCCLPSVCAAPEQQAQAAVPAPPQLFGSPVVDVQTAEPLIAPSQHVADGDVSHSPPLTRLRLARLSTLLI